MPLLALSFFDMTSTGNSFWAAYSMGGLGRGHSRKKAGSRDPGSRTFFGQIRKVEARLGKLAKIRKVETD